MSRRAKSFLYPRACIRIVLALLTLAALVAVPAPVTAQQPQQAVDQQGGPRYFAETGHSISGDFRRYYESRGDLAIFGLPLTREFQFNGRTTQFFERAVFQSFPELAEQGFGVQLMLLGNEAARGKSGAAWERLANRPADRSVQFFAETGHSLGGRFLSYWQQRDGLNNLGLPISETFEEQNPPPPLGDGKPHLVQYFERARLEYHPEFKGTPSEISLGLLGTAFMQAQNLPAPVVAREAAPNTAEANAPITPETPNGKTIRPQADADGEKHVTLTAEVVEQELLNTEGKRVVAKTYGYNGGSPGPTLVFTIGDKVAITVVNKLPEATSVHWHGVIVPNSQDGVPEVSEPTPLLKPGDSYTYRLPSCKRARKCTIRTPIHPSRICWAWPVA